MEEMDLFIKQAFITQILCSNQMWKQEPPACLRSILAYVVVQEFSSSTASLMQRCSLFWPGTWRGGTCALGTAHKPRGEDTRILLIVSPMASQQELKKGNT